MTRINAGIDPKLLHRRHLVAEYREITMVPAALNKSLRTKDTKAVLNSVPEKFTLNSGHVKFFYDKQLFLWHRFNLLCDELHHRGYKADLNRDGAFNGFTHEFYRNWVPTEEDNALVWERINLRISEKPHLYDTI